MNQHSALWTLCRHGRLQGYALYLASALFCAAQTTGTALVRHAPTLNGSIDGSVQQMLGEAVTFNGGAVVTGDLLVPGTPTVRLNGQPAYAGTVDGSGSTSPSNYQITLNGNAALRHVVRRTNAGALPTVTAPPQPTGTRSVTINSSSDSPGNFGTLRNLTLNGNVGQFAIPAGTYGDFAANGGSGFTLGVAGATQPAVYNFQHLTLNGNTHLEVVGPVVLNVNYGFTANGNLGSTLHPAWLTLNIFGSDGFVLNGGSYLYGSVNAPQGLVTINGNSQLVGGVTCDRLTVNGNGLLRLAAPNLPPSVSLTAPVAGAVFTVPATINLQATATDSDGTVTKVEFFNGVTKLGEATAAPYQFSWALVAAGTYSLTAKATDNTGATTTSSAVTIIVNAPPSVALTAPANNTVVAAPATITLQATATDADGTIAKVEFFQGTTKLGDGTPTTGQPSTFTLPFTFTAGTYALTAASRKGSCASRKGSG